MMPDLSVEYLIVMKANEGFCDSTKSFNNLLCANSNIIIKGNQLTYKKLTVGYRVQTNVLEEHKQRYFRLNLDCDDKNSVEEFAELLKAVRTMAYKTNGHFAVLWDDISFYYATLAYPRVNQIENLLRKLIARFMYTSVGMDWGDTTLPDDLRSSIKRNKRNRQAGANLLHDTDFVQLADYLFKPYQSPTNGSEIIQVKISESSKAVDLDIDELKSYLPRSNWTRYFAEIVNCDDSFLDKRWRKLYELRNLVAHNSMLSKNHYEELLELIKEVRKPIEEAIDHLDKLVIPDSEKETIAENFAANRGPLYGEFILVWKQIESELVRIQEVLSNESQPRRFRGAGSAIEELRNAQLINAEQYSGLSRSRKIRNMVVHAQDAEITNNLLSSAIMESEYILEWLKNILPPNRAST